MSDGNVFTRVGGGGYPSLWSYVRSGREYPSLWSQVLSGGKVPQARIGVTLSPPTRIEVPFPPSPGDRDFGCTYFFNVLPTRNSILPHYFTICHLVQICPRLSPKYWGPTEDHAAICVTTRMRVDMIAAKTVLWLDPQIKEQL